MPKPPLREGDRVRVVIPRFVSRVGYPKSVDDYLWQVAKSDDEIKALVKKVTGDAFYRGGRSYNRICRELAYLLAVGDGFGGNERSIHWVEYPTLAGKETIVYGVRTRVTGHRIGASGGYSTVDGYVEAEPPSFEVDKRWRIATVGLHAPPRGLCPFADLDDGGVHLVMVDDKSLEIPVEHLELA